MNIKPAALLLVALVLPGICSAQSLKPGLWTGTADVPGEGGLVNLTFDVTTRGDTLGIEIHAGEHGDFVTESPRFADNNISFVFHPGPRVVCTLTRNGEGFFAGSCLGDDGSDVKMTMVPPKE